MTNLSDSFRKEPNRLIIIHGLNNREEAFDPLKEHFTMLGWETRFLTLPCHGAIRKEANDFKGAFDCFDQSIKHLTDRPYAVIAFSQGALYLQLWLEKRPDRRPLAQVLLAPALHIRRHQIVERIFNTLPSFLFIKSFASPLIKKYKALNVWEYRILLGGLSSWQKLNTGLKSPTLVIIDPKDELVDPDALEKHLITKSGGLVNFVLWNREYLKKGLGQHHIIFHPDYFSPEEWINFTDKINDFVTAHTLKPGPQSIRTD